jgi:hypothetical protein
MLRVIRRMSFGQTGAPGVAIHHVDTVRWDNRLSSSTRDPGSRALVEERVTSGIRADDGIGRAAVAPAPAVCSGSMRTRAL